MIEPADDMAIVLFYMRHIDHPCIERATGHNIREVYLREAANVLPTLKNPFARSLLENKINEYKR